MIKSSMGSKFKPKPGQVDFTNVRFAPVINCVLKYKDKILLVKRSEKMKIYPGLWNNIAGFLDDKKTLQEKVIEEIREETGIAKKDVVSIRLGKVYETDDDDYKKTWIVHPVLVKVNTDKVRLDWEASEYKWMTVNETKKIDRVPGYDLVIKSLLKWL